MAVKPASPMMAALRDDTAWRKRHHPFSGNPGVAGEPTVVGHPQVVTLDQDASPRDSGSGSSLSAIVPVNSTPGINGN